jgi:outer membrane murein-binding lipoprotein Lpp
MRKPSVVVAPSSVFASLVAILQARVTDVQILTLALTLLGIFAASWFNNSRIGDVSTRIGEVSSKIDVRVNDVRDVLRSEMKAMQAETNLQFERMNNKIDTILKLVADIDTRVTALESRKL